MKKLIRHIRQVAGQWKLIAVIYVAQLLLAGVIGSGLYSLISDRLSHTVALSKIAEGWDYTAVHDFLYHNTFAMNDVKGRLSMLIIVYLLISTIISAGIWQSIHLKLFSFSIIGLGIKRVAMRFIGLSLMALVVFVVWSLIVLVPYFTNVMSWLENQPDERFVVYLGLGLLLIWWIGVLLILVITYVARAAYIRDDVSFMTGVQWGSRYLWQRGRGLIAIIWVVSLISLLLTYISVVWEAKIGLTSVALIILAMVVQQLVIWSRIVLRYGLISYVLDSKVAENE